MHEEKGFDADQPDQHQGNQRDRGIRRLRADPWLPAAPHEADRQAVLQQEKISGTEAEHHQRMTIEPVLQAAPARARIIFAHSQRIDIADAAAIEIAGGGVVNGVGAAPEIIGRHGENADDAANPVVRPFIREECAVAAIVLDHEQPHQKPCCRNRDQQRHPPIAQRIDEPGRSPERDQWQSRDRQFDHAADAARLAVAVENLRPTGVGDGDVGVVSNAQGDVPG